MLFRCIQAENKKLEIPFPVSTFLLFLVFCTAAFLLCRTLIQKKEV